MEVRTYASATHGRLISRISSVLRPQWRVDLPDQLFLAVIASLLFASGRRTSFLSAKPSVHIYVFFLSRSRVLLRGGIFTKLHLKLLGHGICYLINIGVQVDRRLLLLPYYALDAVHLFRCTLDSLH